MIISRTPMRLSIVGGGTDYAEYSESFGGAVIGFAINRYCFITYRQLPPFFEHKHHIVYSKTEDVDAIDGIAHPGVRETLRWLDVSHGTQIHHAGDLPARSGIGSSSAFVVGLLNAIHASRGRSLGPRRLAMDAYHVEHELAGEDVGYQDQVLSAYGGFRHVGFRGHNFEIRNHGVGPNRVAELVANLMLVYTKTTRMSSPIAASYVANMHKRANENKRVHDMVGETLAVLEGGGRLHAIGEMLHESWELKKIRGTGVSTPALDAIYSAAREAGATGGKVVGAGGAGFMLFFVPPQSRIKVESVMTAMGNIVVPFGYEPEGSKIIYNDSNMIEDNDEASYTDASRQQPGRT